MSEKSVVDVLQEVPVLGIIRHPCPFDVVGLFFALREAGLKAVEITRDTPDADKLITIAREKCADSLVIGCGTVVTVEEADEALSAGAQFIVSPVTDRELIKYCVSRDVPVFPGALTPTEIELAWRTGASMVKVFPASLGGPNYIKAVRGPLKSVGLMAVGGVNPDNAAEYLRYADAIAIGGGTIKAELIDAGDFSAIQTAVKTLLKTIA